jgi:GxxExxY protein
MDSTKYHNGNHTDIEQVFKDVLDCSFKVHSALGPGLLESVYEECLSFELREKGYVVERQKPLKVVYRGIAMDAGYRVDLLVEDNVIVELKSVEALNELHLAQILTYLKLSSLKLGLLVNFNVKHLKDGIKRVIN